MLLPKSKKYQRNKLLNVLIYFHEVEKCSFPYFYTHLILFPKMENIVAIHFFARNTKNYLYIFIIIMYIYIYIIIYIFIYIYICIYIYIYIYILQEAWQNRGGKVDTPMHSMTQVILVYAGT